MVENHNQVLVPHIGRTKNAPLPRAPFWGGQSDGGHEKTLSRDQIDHVNDGRGWEAQGQRGKRVQVSIMTFSACRQARAWVLFQQLIMTLFLGYVCSTSTVPALGT